MFGLFNRKKEVEQLKETTKKGFDDVKRDINSIDTWMKYMDSEKNLQKKEVEDVKEILSTVKQELNEVKSVMSFIGEMKINKPFKTGKQVFKEQTGVYAVQTAVQTGVQTPNFDNFSITERAILWILLNTDMKLSYEDLGSMLGKEKTTIRGQINSIKQRSESLIEEIIEKNGKKRVFIPENIKEKLLKKSKVRVKKDKKIKKTKKKEKKKVSNY